MRGQRMPSMGACLLGGALALGLGAPAAHAQGGGVGPAPTEARAVISKAVEALGGRRNLAKVASAVMIVDADAAQIQERHALRLDGRFMHYASRRSSGAGFDVVLARRLAFLCDRDPQGKATYVEDLSPGDAQEGAYERDILFMPLLLPSLLEKGARLDYRGRNSEGHEVIRAQIRPPGQGPGEAFTIRLLFDRESHLLLKSMGVVPWGTDKGEKRYCTYEDYAKVPGTPVRLPSRLADQRGEGREPRVFRVRWELNADLPASLFVKPRLESDEKD